MRRLFIVVGIFSLAALVGPLIGYLSPPPWKIKESVGGGASSFLYDLVFLLWPTQPLAVVEASIGSVAAGALAIGTNVLLFAVIGLITGMLAKRSAWLITDYAAVCALVLLVALWGAGFDLSYLNWASLIVAFAFYAVPFWIVARKINA